MTIGFINEQNQPFIISNAYIIIMMYPSDIIGYYDALFSIKFEL